MFETNDGADALGGGFDGELARVLHGGEGFAGHFHALGAGAKDFDRGFSDELEGAESLGGVDGLLVECGAVGELGVTELLCEQQNSRSNVHCSWSLA